MNRQLQLAFGLVEGRVWSDQNWALQREAELLREARRGRRWWRAGR